MAETKYTAERIERIIADLTNGVGEKPYCRRVDRQMVVFVADDQEYCRIAEIDDWDEQVAQAICESGLLIDTLRRQRDMLKKRCESAVTVFRDIKSRHTSSSFHNNRIASDCNEAIAFLEAAIAACKENQ